MKSYFSLIILASTLTLTSCSKASKAIDATNSMPGIMNGMDSKMQLTLNGINDTNESVRLQKLILAKNDMLDDKNTKTLEPVALGMIAGAKKFAEAATPEELMEYTFILLKEINDEKPDESLKNEQGEFPASVIEEFDHQKMVLFSQVLTISGFTPQDKVETIINDQIYGGGLYQDEAYTFLMTRVFFLATYLDNSLLSKPLSTIHKMDETINRVGYIDYILKLPFKYNVKMNITGFLKRDPIEISLYGEDGTMDDTWNAPKLWKKVSKGFKSDLKDGNIVSGSSLNAADVAHQMANLKDKVDSYIASWK